MSTLSGINARVKVGDPKVIVADLAKYTISDNMEALRAPVFGNTWDKIHGMSVQKVSGTISGYLNLDDTTGQDIIRTAYNSRTAITLFFLYLNDITNASTYFAPDTVTDADAGVYITSMENSAEQNAIIPIEFTFEVTGAWARFTEPII